MKPFRILACFAVLYAGASIYSTTHFNSQPIYWLVGKLICLFIILIGLVFNKINDKKDANSIAMIFLCASFFLFLGYRDISEYKKSACQAKFGPEFNTRRHKLGAPEIPGDWLAYRKLTGSVDWKAKDNIGHVDKYIDIDSSCKINYEEDEYRLKSFHGIPRYVTIRTYYAKGKASDSIFYSYDLPDSSRLISRQQADSIFAAEKIKKDY